MAKNRSIGGLQKASKGKQKPYKPSTAKQMQDARNQQLKRAGK
ncbi:hypothetical protein [Cytobacillus firmus]|nr:hypothetical protein [Cytobacillus firmus]